MRFLRVPLLMLSLLLGSPAAAPVEETIVATVDDHTITAAELQPFLELSREREPGTPASLDARQAALEQVIIERLLLDEAIRRGFLDDFRVRGVMVKLLLKEVIYSEVRPEEFTDEVLRAYFDAHREAFIVPKKLRIRRIFVSTTARSPREARQLIADLRRQLLADPEQFAALAWAHSEDTYRDQYGDLGYIKRSGQAGVPDEVVEVAFALEVGELSRVFPSEGGLNLVYVSDAQAEIERSFEEVRDLVLRLAMSERRKEVYEARIVGLRAAMPVAAAADYAGLSVEGYTLQAAELPAEVAFRVGDLDIPVALLDVKRARSPDLELAEVAVALLDDAVLFIEARRRGYQTDPSMQRLLINLLLQEGVTKRVRFEDLTDDVLRAYFDAHRDELIASEKVHIKRIFVSATARPEAEARALMEDLRRQILADPERFAALARAHSEDTYKSRGGNLGFVHRNGRAGVPDEVVEVAFTLEGGQLSAVFEAGDGLNLVLVVARGPADERTFEQLKPSLSRRVMEQTSADLYDTLIAELRAKAAVRVDSQALLQAELIYTRSHPPTPQEEAGQDDP